MTTSRVSTFTDKKTAQGSVVVSAPPTASFKRSQRTQQPKEAAEHRIDSFYELQEVASSDKSLSK